MTVKRLLTVVFGIVGIAIAMGVLSLSAQMQAATCTAGESVGHAGERQRVDPGAFLVADIVRDGDQMLLFPQTGEAVRCKDGAICTTDGPYLFEDGKLYTWVNAHRHRIWLFGVISESRPSVQVNG